MGTYNLCFEQKYEKISQSHRIGGNRERKFFNKFSFQLPKSILWQLKMSNLHSPIAILAIKNSLFGNHERLTYKLKNLRDCGLSGVTILHLKTVSFTAVKIAVYCLGVV